MKLISTFKAVAMVLLMLVTTPSFAKEAVVALSPFASPAELETTLKDVAFHLAETVEAGETAYVVDAYTLTEIASFHVPDDPERFDKPRKKMRVNGDFFANMKRFAENAITPSNSETFSGQIDLSGLYRMIEGSYPTDKPRDLILYGVSPISHNPLDTGYSMQGGVIPDDDHIAASRAKSPFGAAEQKDALANYTVHWGMNDTSWHVSDRHAHFMERFVALSVSERGGTLITFAPNAETALRNARSGVTKPIGSHQLETDGTPEMVHFRQEEAIRTDDTLAPIYERVLSERVPDEREVVSAQNVEIAIRWTCDCDFDLAVKYGEGEIISFRTPKVAGGTLFKDFTSSQSLNNGWETIELSGSSVDLSALTIAINLYSGSGTNTNTVGKSVELRIAINGETWGKQFAITGRANSGDGFLETMNSDKAANASWIVPSANQIVRGK